jgi:hypothetical protein
MMTTITTDDMLAAISAAVAGARKPPPSDPGATVAEYSKHAGLGKDRARKQIAAAVEAGALVAGRRWVEDAAGRIVSMTVYRPRE